MSSQRNFFDRYARGQSSQPVTGYNQASNINTNVPQTNSTILGQAYNQTSTFSNQGFSTGSNVVSQSTSSYEVEGRKEQREADRSTYLKWASELTNNVLISGSNDYTRLTNLREAILELKNQHFNINSGLSVQGAGRDQLARRFLHIEHEVEGLLRRRIDLITRDQATGQRDLDFASVLTEKQNIIIELQKENENLRERLRLSNVSRAELQATIEKLTRDVFLAKGLKGQGLDNAVQREQNYAKTQRDLATLRQTFASIIGIWQSQLQSYKSKFPNNNWDLDSQVTRYIQEFNIQPIQVNGYSVIELPSTRTRKWVRQNDINEQFNLLIRKSFVEILHNYPNIKTSIDPRIISFISSTADYGRYESGTLVRSNIDTTVDVLDEVSLNRLVEIVKYVPETVRVENVYTYGSSRAKKIEFHLRVLIKALLEQLEKVKAKYGIALQIDQGVIGMINQEVLDIISVDDILKVFRVKERIVEVERIVEKVVEKIVEVPQIIPVEKYVEKIVEVPRYIEVEKIIHKPVEVIKVVDNIIEKFIQVPTIEQKIIQVPTERQVVVPLQKEVPKIVEVEKIVKEVVVDTKYVEIQKPVNHIITETKTLQVIKEVPIIQQTVREVLKPVEFLVEKIVPVEVVRVQVVQVEKIVEKIIKQIVHVPVTNETLIIQEKIVEVPVYIQKLVPVETIVNKIVNVPQRIQVPVIVKETVQEIKTVEVIVEKIVEKIVIREVEKIKNVIIENVVQKIKTVEKKIEVPILQDRIVTVNVQVPKIVIQRVHVPHVVPVKCVQEKIIEKPKIVQVEKPYIQYIKDVQVVNCVVEKIVEVPRIIERIKEVKVKVQKIVNKLVEVPRVVQVEKVVEKIVVVPRVIEKIIQVPQIVEVVVQKIVEVPTVKVVEKIVQKIVYVDKPVEVQKIRNVYLEVDRPVEKIKEIPVVAETVIEKKEIVQVPVEKLVTVNKEVPVQIFVDNVVEKVVECAKLIEVQKQELVVVEVPKIVDRYVEKPVEVRSTFVEHKEIHIPVQVPIREEIIKTNIVQIEKVIKQPIAVIEPKVYTETKVVINEKFTPVKEEIKVPVILPAERPFVQPIVVDRFIEKPVEVIVEIRQEKAIKIQNNVPVEVYRVVELNNDRCLIGTEHKIVRETVDRFIPVSTYEQYAVPVEIAVEKIVNVKSVETRIKPEVQVIQKVIQKENFTTVHDKVPYYEERVQVVDRFQSTQVPAFTTQERIVTVPEFQQKIYERIIVMPQIVEVVKYITEICEAENSLIAGVHVDILEQEKQYKELYGVSRKQLEILLVELRKLRGTQPNLAGIIELVERYLIDFDRLASVQKIVPVEREKIVEKEVPRAVLVPTQDSETIRNQLAYSLLIEKLIVELKRIKKENNNVKLQLDNDLSLFFFNEVYDQTNAAGNFQESLTKYTKESLSKLNSLGGDWTHSHQVMLSTILAERFTMANLVKQANIEIERVQAISAANANAVKNLENKWLPLQRMISEKRDALNRVLANNATLRDYPQLVTISKDFDSIVAGNYISFEPIKVIQSTFTVGTGTNWNRAVSRINELDLANKALTQKLIQAEKRSLTVGSVDTTTQFTIAALRSENERLVSQIDNLKKTASVSSNNSQLQRDLEQSQAKVRSLSSRIQELELQLKTANSRNSDLDSQIRSLNLRIQELDTQLRTTKDIKSSAASENSQLVDSKYSSSSSSNINVTKTAFEVPSYASSSVYSVESSGLSQIGGLSSSGVRAASTISNYQTAGNTYGTAGTGAFQSASKLSNSGFQITNAGESNNFSSYGVNATKTTTNVTSGSSSSTANFGTYGTAYGTSPLTTEYGATRFNTITTGTTGPSYSTTGISSQYGAANLASSTTNSGLNASYSSSVNSSLSGSGLRQSGTGFSTSGQSGTSFSSSNYTFQTKKF